MAQYWPWPIVAGNDVPYPFVFRDSLGVALNLTGAELLTLF